MDFDPELHIVAGANNAGKSSLVRMLEVFFDDPSGDDLLSLHPQNSYYSEVGPRSLSSVAVWFTDLTDDERETFTPVLRHDGYFWIEIRCSRAGQVSYRASKSVSSEQARAMYEAVLARFTFVKIPSVRVASTEAEVGESPSLGRLLDTLEAVLVRAGSTRSTALQQDFRQKMAPVEALILDTLNQSAAGIRSDLPFQESSIEFRLPEPRAALRGMLEAAVIESHGDAKVPLSARGTGFQSALVLGVLRYVAEREASSGGNLMFAIEEPEAFLHPQTQRAMASILRDIATKAQLLITTHSSVIVDSFEIGRIARLPLQPDGVELLWRLPSLTKSQAGRLTRHCSAANSELVFANAVVLVEGEGDRALSLIHI